MKEQWNNDKPGGNRADFNINKSQNSTDPMVDPEFSFNSADVNLKYKKFFPFIGAFLFYKFIWKKI